MYCRNVNTLSIFKFRSHADMELQRKRIFIWLLLLLFIPGCNTYRLVPSHGGGKRFDEEERAVSAAIRNAVAQLNVKNLAGHKINVTVVTLAHNGGGNVTLPGFSSANLSYSNNDTDYWAPYMIHNQDTTNFSLGYNPNVTAYPTVFGTDQDISYLEATVQMRLRLEGAMVTVPDPEYVFYVLVDVLGTNRSKQDSFVVWDDTLTASCELTYYVLETKTNKVAFTARRAGAEASYRESSIFGFAGYSDHRAQRQTIPNPMPTEANDPVIVALQSDVSHIEQAHVAKTNPKPAENKQILAQKLGQAQNYVQAGNWQAAEQLMIEIRAVAPNYPGLDALNSSIANSKAAAIKK
jgi:hypothetical protein